MPRGAPMRNDDQARKEHRHSIVYLGLSCFVLNGSALTVVHCLWASVATTVRYNSLLLSTVSCELLCNHHVENPQQKSQEPAPARIATVANLAGEPVTPGVGVLASYEER